MTRLLVHYVVHIIYSRFSWPRPHCTYCPILTGILFFTIVIFLYMLISMFPASHISQVCHGSTCMKLNNYLYILIYYSLVLSQSQIQGGVDILISVPYIHYARFHQENLKRDSLNSFPSKVSCYFFTLLISNCKFEISTMTQIYL